MTKQASPKRPRGRPIGSTKGKKKAVVPIKKAQGINKFMSSKLEESINSVEVKREKLNQIADMKRKKQMGLVSPEPKPKHKQVLEDEEMAEVGEKKLKSKGRREEEPFNINPNTVSQYIKSRRMGQLLSLPLEQMQKVLEAWRTLKKQENPKGVWTTLLEVLMLEIEEAKEDTETEERVEVLRRKIENEVNQDLERIKTMNLTKSSNLAVIKKFSKNE